MVAAPTLEHVVGVLESLAPLDLAEAWDNVGLLVEADAPRGIRRVLLAIDLTGEVLAEACAMRAELVVAYHPPIFEGMKRLRRADTKARIVLDALAHGVSVYSPHTALDCVEGGVNDWLAGAFACAARRPIRPIEELAPTREIKIVTFVPPDHVARVRQSLADAGAGVIGRYAACSFESEGHGTFLGMDGTSPALGQAGRFERVAEVRLEMVCARRDLLAIERALRAAHPYEEIPLDAYPLAPLRSHSRGQGREIELSRPISLAAAVRRVKRHTGLKRLRVATAARHAAGASLARVALCAGAGGAVLKGSAADLLLTGEMRHHDVLAAVESGTSVILCDHTNTERGYLPVFAERLGVALPQLAVAVSERDRDPLEVV